MKTIKQLRQAIEEAPARSAWRRGIKDYAAELLEDLPDDQEFFGSPSDEKILLNGADDWSQFSYGGCSLIYDQDIAERLCTPSEYKRSREGERRPNARESWLDCQARALFQASNLICRLAKD
jgi:hypothetical protein